MAISNLITLPEYAKGFAREDVRRTVIEMFTQYSDIFEVMPFETLRGSKYTGYREAALPAPVFRAINEASSSGHGTISPFDESTNPRVFNGLNVRARKFGRLYHNSTASGGAALSLANLDQFLNNISRKSGTTYMMVPFVSLPLWIQAARTQTLTGFVMQTWDQTGLPKLSYANLRILFGYPKDDQVPVLQFNEVATGGGSAVTASLYDLTLGEGMMRGITVRPLTPEDVGLLHDRKTYRTHIGWDVGLVDEFKYCMGRLDSWTNAPIVA